MVPKQEYALKLETAFRIGDDIPVCADSFRLNYQESLKIGFAYLVKNQITDTKKAHFWETEYSFTGYSLDNIVENPVKREKLDELLVIIRGMK